MPTRVSDPIRARQFAVEAVGRLREAHFDAFFAGGCVRDELLGRVPADYDVATSAKPDEVRGVFGHRRTLAVGAAFGVITVVGPLDAGQVEVTTFRTDAAYTDGRHPAGVTFSTPQEDAQRRDFTINGLFLDPLSGEVHDYVHGRDDLAAGIVRAIGSPALRFGEDHLRMLRAVRFAAGFGFVLERETFAAIQKMSHLVMAVSPERIAAELRAMVSRSGRGRALELLEETGLAREVLPEVAPADRDGSSPLATWRQSAQIIQALHTPDLASSLSVLFCAPNCEAKGARRANLQRAVSRLRLSNRESQTAGWLLATVEAIETPEKTADAQAGGLAGTTEIAGRPWSQVQPWLAHPDAVLLADVLRARADGGRGSAQTAAWVSQQLTRSQDDLNPPPLLTGNDLLAMGVPAGRPIGAMLASLRRLQLDREIQTRNEAMEQVELLRKSGQ